MSQYDKLTNLNIKLTQLKEMASEKCLIAESYAPDFNFENSIKSVMLGSSRFYTVDRQMLIEYLESRIEELSKTVLPKTGFEVGSIPPYFDYSLANKIGSSSTAEGLVDNLGHSDIQGPVKDEKDKMRKFFFSQSSKGS